VVALAYAVMAAARLLAEGLKDFAGSALGPEEMVDLNEFLEREWEADYSEHRLVLESDLPEPELIDT